MTYAGFWRRFGAFWIDFIVLTPLMVAGYYGLQHSRLFHIYWLIPGAVFGLWFHVYLVWRYGGTPGKLLLRTKIVMVDGSPITQGAALVRYSVLFALSLLNSIALCYASLNISDEQYLAASATQRHLALVALSPSWHKPVDIALQIWIWSEFMTVLFNEKRRGVHDLMAKTVVIRTGQ